MSKSINLALTLEYCQCTFLHFDSCCYDWMSRNSLQEESNLCLVQASQIDWISRIKVYWINLFLDHWSELSDQQDWCSPTSARVLAYLPRRSPQSRIPLAVIVSWQTYVFDFLCLLRFLRALQRAFFLVSIAPWQG